MILNEPAAQKEAFNLASLLTNVNPYNLIKPKVVNDYLLSIVMAKELAKISLNLSKPDIHALKKSLPLCGNTVYGYKAPHKTGAGIGVLKILKATYDAPSVFFYVVGLTHPFFGRWCIIQRLCQSMVAQAGASSEAPVSFRAGYANPVWATTSEIGVSGGSVTCYLKEAAIMATTPTQKPSFIWLIAAVRRDCPTITAKIHHIAAESERDARRSLVRDHVCFFAGRIRMEVAHD
ncbi:TPA: host cell division inhibitor Icd-like protein [Escherichia coli]|uniref:host cell division inhibitor Icd-like protein n=1 Tax=Escherichia coli TaxID=562 RepID=UPI002B00236F|nr:host cell division inhibitor Icd-like protein [Escherichia coli]